MDSGSLADDYAVEMLMGETLSHIDGQGLLPFERYCFASGSTFPHHVEECLCQASPEEGATFEMSSDAVKEQALGLLGREIMGGGETGVARNKVLGASHTHAAVGLAINATSFRMVILVVDQCTSAVLCSYLELCPALYVLYSVVVILTSPTIVFVLVQTLRSPRAMELRPHMAEDRAPSSGRGPFTST